MWGSISPYPGFSSFWSVFSNAPDAIDNTNLVEKCRCLLYLYIIIFKVNKFVDSDEDEIISDSVVPFVVAYAVSIHKSQGLEYSSVKIIITKETEELINHNIFYTAITRARDSLKIYWSPESEKKIIGEMKRNFNEQDTGIIKYKMTAK